jgi:hypothetical protein
VAFENATYAVTKGEITKFDSTPGRTRRGFCAKCGSTLTCESAGLPTETHFPVGAFDEAARLEPTRHVFPEERLPWLRQFSRSTSRLCAALPRDLLAVRDVGKLQTPARPPHAHDLGEVLMPGAIPISARTFAGSGPQRLPPLGIGHCCPGEKPTIMATMHAPVYSIDLMIEQ